MKTPGEVAVEVLRAERRIRDHIRETPLDESEAFSRRCDSRVFLKSEHLQLTSSFKLRGAMNRVLAAPSQQRDRGFTTASTGNHGKAVAYCLKKFGGTATVFVPEGASPTKVDSIRRSGLEVHFQGGDSVEAEEFARTWAAEKGLTYLSPYNDPLIVGGQGTVGLEIYRQRPGIDSVLVAVGGGGLISGVAGYLKFMTPGVRVIGCSPENSCVMMRSLEAGRIVQLESQPTLSDGTAGGIEENSITLELCRNLVDDFILVSENEIREAMLLFMEHHHQLIEGSAGVALAALLKQRRRFRGQNVAVILCGGNLGLETLKEVLSC